MLVRFRKEYSSRDSIEIYCLRYDDIIYGFNHWEDTFLGYDHCEGFIMDNDQYIHKMKIIHNSNYQLINNNNKKCLLDLLDCLKRWHETDWSKSDGPYHFRVTDRNKLHIPEVENMQIILQN